MQREGGSPRARQHGLRTALAEDRQGLRGGHLPERHRWARRAAGHPKAPPGSPLKGEENRETSDGVCKYGRTPDITQS